MELVACGEMAVVAADITDEWSAEVAKEEATSIAEERMEHITFGFFLTDAFVVILMGNPFNLNIVKVATALRTARRLTLKDTRMQVKAIKH